MSKVTCDLGNALRDWGSNKHFFGFNKPSKVTSMVPSGRANKRGLPGQVELPGCGRDPEGGIAAFAWAPRDREWPPVEGLQASCLRPAIRVGC